MSDPKLQRIKPARLSDQAVEQIRTLIIDGHFLPGAKLPSEAQLGAMLKVSRSSVREALRSLESKGLIQVRSGAGAFVADRPFSFGRVSEAIEWLLGRQESLAQILQVREALEGLTASLLAPIVTEAVLKELREILQEQCQVEESLSSVDQESLLDIRFHETIARASGNQMAEELVEMIVTAFSSSNRAVLYISGKMGRSIGEHQRIVDALATRNPAVAEQAMRSHIERVRTEILTVPRDGAAAS